MTKKKTAPADDPAAEGLEGMDSLKIEPVEEAVAPGPAPGKPVDGYAPAEPEIHDPGWTRYVLSRLGEEEVWDGHPTVPGLRRVASELLGDIVENTAEPVATPANAVGLWATVKATVVIAWRKGLADGEPPQSRVFTGLADGNADNLERDFLRFASPTSETRAEGRALRKALQLSVVTAEEMTDVEVQEVRPDGRIDPAHKNFIDLKCSQCDVDLRKYLATWKGRYKSLDDVPYGVAQQMVRHLGELQRDRQRIPDDLKGYDRNWQSEGEGE